MKSLLPSFRASRCAAALLWAGALAARAEAQQPLTRRQAVEAALARGSRVALAQADSAATRAQVLLARAFQNPVLTAEYTRSVPQYHAAAELPLDYPWVRSARIRAAVAADRSTQHRLAFERAAARFDAETAYALALAAAARAGLSRRNVHDADSLLRMARARRDAGDASELDVQLAVVNAGQLANAAADDSLAGVQAVLDLQLVMGLAAESVLIALADTLALQLPDTTSQPAGATLRVAAADAALRSKEAEVALERRSIFRPPALVMGFENHDPTGAEPGVLPTIGLAFAVPLLNWNRAGIAAAEAGLGRARAELGLAQRESDAAVAGARRLLDVARAKAERDRSILSSAEQVAAMALRAYAEGAAALPSVLEAQRNARQLLAQYVDDLAAADAAASALRLVSAAASRP